jgi:hypothetical protein
VAAAGGAAFLAACDANEDCTGSPRDTICVPASSGVVRVPAAVQVAGQGVRVAVDIAAGGGTVRIDGRALPTVVHERTRSPSGDFDSYQALAVGGDALFMIWLYCSSGELRYLYFEGTAGPGLTREDARGSCVETGGAGSVSMAFPHVAMPVPPGADAVAVDGADVSFAPGRGAGTVRLGGAAWVWSPFSYVDCTRCGPTSDAGWHELHSLLWDPGAHRLLTGIFFFATADPAHTSLQYVFGLPALAGETGIYGFDASWTRL